MELRIWIPGDPTPLHRPRACRAGSRVRMYSDQEKEMNAYRLELLRHVPVGWSALQGPIALECRFYFQVPVSAPKKRQALMLSGGEFHTKKPDGSNLLKFVEDCGNGVLWTDDKQIVRASFCKSFGVQAGTEIAFREI